MSESETHLSKYAAIFAGGTTISRVSGLLRDIVMTAVIPTQALAAFNIAFRLPNMLRDLVGEGASNAAFVPVLSETLEKESMDGFRRAVSALMSAMIVLLGVITILGVVFMPLIFNLLKPVGIVTGSTKLPEEYQALLMSLTRWNFPYIFFIGLTVFQMGPLFIMRHYSTPSWSPALLNVCQILACGLWVASQKTFSNAAYALVLGAWMGGISQFLVQYLAVGKHVGVWVPSFNLRHPNIRTAFWLLVPVLLGQSAGEVNKMVDLLFATSFGDTAVNALFYANRLVQLPLSIFGIAISVAILPSISRAAARKAFPEIRETLLNGFRQTYFLIAPAVAALIVIPKPIIALLFERGHFQAVHTEATAAALAYFSVGLLCFAWVKVAVSGFYAIQDTKTPVTVAFISMVGNIALIFALAGPMGFTGLALATTLSYTLNFTLLYVLLSRRYGRLWDAPFASDLIRITLVTLAMAAILYAAYAALHNFMPGEHIFPRLICVTISLTVAGLSYLLLSLAAGISDARAFLSILNRR